MHNPAPEGIVSEMRDCLESRLAYCCTVLSLIDRRRAETGDEGIGAAVERRILDREIKELEDLAVVEGMAKESGF